MWRNMLGYHKQGLTSIFEYINKYIKYENPQYPNPTQPCDGSRKQLNPKDGFGSDYRVVVILWGLIIQLFKFIIQ